MLPRTIRCPLLHEKAFANWGRLATMPLMRYLPGECGLVMALARRFFGRSFSQAHWAEADEEALLGRKPAESKPASRTSTTRRSVRLDKAVNFFSAATTREM